MDISIHLSDPARDFLADLLKKQKVDGIAARLFVTHPGTRMAETCLAYCRPGDEKANDKRLQYGDLVLYLDSRSLPYLDDLEIGLTEERLGKQLTIKAPNAKKPKTTSDEYKILQRDCRGQQVPSGDPVVIPAGTEVRITQALGGSYTVLHKGNLVRVEGKDAQALGLSNNELQFDPPEDGSISSDQVWEALATVFDPEIPVNIVSLGLVYKMKINQNSHHVEVDMTLTAPGCGMGQVLVDDVKAKLAQVPYVETTDVELVFDPPWQQDMMSEEAKLETGLFF